VSTSRPSGRPSRPRRLTLLIGLYLLGAAQASPASDLLSAVSTDLQRDYYGWSETDRGALVKKYRSVLITRCESAGEACDFDTGRAVASEMLSELHDAHTSVRDAEAAARLSEVQNDLSVPRSGLRVLKQPNGLLVVGVQPESPGERVGLKVYDLIVAVNDKPAGKDKAVDSLAFVRLERASTPLSMQVQRAGQKTVLSFQVTPELAKARDVSTLSYPRPGTALITLPTFLPGDSAKLFLDKVAEAKKGGARELVIDLRFNGGGRLDQCVAAASIFRPVVYQARFRGGSWTYSGLNGEQAPALSARLDRESRIWDGPAAVLVGENTASCAEVFAFFAHKTGVKVVGSPTKGVGNSGVSFFPLPDQGVLSLTMLRAFDENGDALPDHIEPDVSAPTDLSALSTTGTDNTLDAALKLLSVPAVDAGQTGPEK
jgi:carboxyl-terminal processing protease